MTFEDLQQLVKTLCVNGTISPENRELIFQQAKSIPGVSNDVVEAVIQAEMNRSGHSTPPPPPSQNPNNSSGFVTSDAGSEKNTNSQEKNNTPPPAPPARLFTNVTQLTHQGAMGLVQKAKLNDPNDRYHQQWVILKRIKPEYAEKQEFRDLFFKEYAILSNLKHPNIIEVLRRGEDEEGAYIYMEYIDGRPLTEVIGNNGITNQILLKKMALEILQALKYIHSKGFFHRDLKPDNILVSNIGDNVKLIDFGLAVGSGFDDNLLKAGTPRYGAPEQLRNTNKKPTQRADIYAFGKIFLQMLTGSTDTIDLLEVTDKNYHEIINKCLQTNPDDRFGYASEIIERIENPEQNQQPKPQQQPQPKPQKRPKQKPKPKPKQNTPPPKTQPTPPPVQNPMAQLKDNANALFEQKRYTEAQELYVQYLRQNPNDSFVKQRINRCREYLAADQSTSQKTKSKRSPLPIIISIIAVVALVVAGYLFRDKIFGDQSIFDNRTEEEKAIDELESNPDVVRADSLFDTKNIIAAHTAYEKAQTALPNNTHITSRLDAIDSIRQAATNLKPAQNSNNLYGYTDANGYLIIDYQYQEAMRFHRGGLAAVRKNRTWGFINKQNETIVPFKYDRVEYTGKNLSVFIGEKGWMLDGNGNQIATY